MNRWSLLIAIAVVACGSSDPGTTSGLKLVSNAKFGNILTDGGGRTLYLFAQDLPSGVGKAAVATCTGACAGLWPSFDAQGGKLEGIDAADVGEITRTDGVKQSTWKGWPLYNFANDGRAGDVNGESIDDWFVIRNPFYTVTVLNGPVLDGTSSTTRTAADYLVDGAGRTLYYFTNDTVGAGTSACGGSATDATTCAGKWPVFLALTAVVPTGIKASDFSVFTNAAVNQPQSTYKGHPLYYFGGDKVPGDRLGDGLSNGKFFTISSVNAASGKL